MKQNSNRSLRLGAMQIIAALGLASLAFAQSDNFAGPHRNYDAREEVRRVGERAPSALQQSRLQKFKKEMPGFRHRVDPATGATRSLSRISGFLTPPSRGDAVTTATSFLETNTSLLGLDPLDVTEYEVEDVVPSIASGSTHVYLQQRRAGLRVYNARYHTNLDREGRITGIANGFIPEVTASVNTLHPRIQASRAVAFAAEHLGIPVIGLPRVVEDGKSAERITSIDPAGISSEPITARLMILPIQAGESRLVWNFQIYTLDHRHWFDMNVDAETGKIWTRFDWVAPDQYRVYAFPAESPNHVQGLPLPPADGRTLVLEPADRTASPEGWHSGNLTEGNNVRAYQDSNNSNSGTSVDCGALRDCDFPVNLTQAPGQYRPGAVTNLFYWNNIIHDIMYQYGFDELSGNFQENNFGRGGKGSDSVNAEAQDGGDANNANFATPPDGANPRMQMYLWTAPSPDKDGDLDNGIIIHEYGHGISSRLVGGPSNVSCLGNEQQPGEGWSDWFALALTAKPDDAGADPRGIATYALNQPTDGLGIRAKRYSTDSSVNNWTYESIRSAVAPHGVGSVWAQALWEVYWALVDRHGFDPNLYNATGGAGNQRALLYVTEGLKNTACSPTFLDARDGIIQAVLNNNPEDECTVWQAFADFGLGVNASTTGSNSSATNGFDVPAQCLCNPQPIANAGPDKSICLGDSTILGTPAQDGNAYSWTPAGETTPQISVSPTATTTYTVTATTACGSAVDSGTVSVDDGSGGGLTENFANGLGNWTAGGLWHLTDDSSCASPGYSSPFNALYYGQESTCNYSTGAANSGNLVSPPIFGITASSILTFDYLRQVESFAGDYDRTRVDVSADGGAIWTNVWSRNAGNLSENLWTSSGNISLAAFAGQSIQVRFHFDTVDNSFNTHTGWFIDDVIITGESLCTGSGGNIPPVAADDPMVGTVSQGGTVNNLPVLANDTDHDGTLNPASVLITGATHGAATPHADGTVTFTHDGSATTTASFTYTVADTLGAVSNVATATLTVIPGDSPPAPNQAPTITSAPVTTATVDQPYTYDVDATDPDSGDTLTYHLDLAPAGMSLEATSGLLTWTPTAGQAGTPHAVLVRVADTGTPSAEASQAFEILVGPGPPPPTAFFDNFDDGDLSEYAALGGDWTTVTEPGRGRVLRQRTNAGTLLYTAAAQFSGNYQITADLWNEDNDNAGVAFRVNPADPDNFYSCAASGDNGFQAGLWQHVQDLTDAPTTRLAGASWRYARSRWYRVTVTIDPSAQTLTCRWESAEAGVEFEVTAPDPAPAATGAIGIWLSSEDNFKGDLLAVTPLDPS